MARWSSAKIRLRVRRQCKRTNTCKVWANVTRIQRTAAGELLLQMEKVGDDATAKEHYPKYPERFEPTWQ